MLLFQSPDGRIPVRGLACMENSMFVAQVSHLAPVLRR